MTKENNGAPALRAPRQNVSSGQAVTIATFETLAAVNQPVLAALQVLFQQLFERSYHMNKELFHAFQKEFTNELDVHMRVMQCATPEEMYRIYSDHVRSKLQKQFAANTSIAQLALFATSTPAASGAAGNDDSNAKSQEACPPTHDLQREHSPGHVETLFGDSEGFCVAARTIEGECSAFGRTGGFAELLNAVTSNPAADRAFVAQRTVLEFGKWVRLVREARRWTLPVLAEKVGSTPSQLSMIERGMGKRGATLELIARILWALECKLTFGVAKR